MTYEDLPFKYKDYAEQQEWDNDQALAYWQQGQEYRAFAEKIVLDNAVRFQGEDHSEMDIHAWNTCTNILMALRGKRIVIQ